MFAWLISAYHSITLLYVKEGDLLKQYQAFVRNSKR